MIRTAVFALSFLMNLRFKQVNDVPITILTTMNQSYYNNIPTYSNNNINTLNAASPIAWQI